MDGKHNQPKTLKDAIVFYSNPDNALAYMVLLRWPDGIVLCPTCGRNDVVFLHNQRKWQCKSVHPKRQFSAKVGTIFEDSPISLEKWIVVVWMLSNCRNGISSYEIARAVGVTQKSAWFMLHRIRLGLKNQNAPKLGGSDSGPVEADETFVGPNPMKMHKSRRAKLAAVASERGEKYRSAGTTIVPNVKRATLQEKILNNVEGGSQVITDDFPVYRYALADQFAHDVVNHAQTYVEGQIHTNGIENFWSLLKRSLRGTYVAVEPFHLDRYVDEQVFRFNNRKDDNGNKLDDAERFNIAMSQVVGKRLTLAELTGKTGDATPF
jgi:transposase-like protein